MNGSRTGAMLDRCAPLGAAIVALAAGASAGWNRDFGIFVYGLLAVPLVVAALVALTASALVARAATHRRSLALSLALLAAIGPIAYAIVNRFRDEVHFAVWAPAHAALLDRFADRDGVIADWDAWGFAGLENEEYLVSIHARPIVSDADVSRWARGRLTPCDVVTFKRLRANVYAVTTMNCAFGPVGSMSSRARSG